MRIWMDGSLVGRDEATVSVFDHGLLYGDGVFEGIRAYGGRIFKMRSHLERLEASARKIRLDLPYSLAELERALRETLEANDLVDGYIRLVVTRGAGTLGLHPFRCPKAGCFVIADKIQLYPEELYENGMHVIVARRPRIPIECLDPSIKSLNYLNNILAKIEAIDAGVLEAIMLNTRGFVAECTGDNLFAVVDGKVLTPPKGAGILHGITRHVVMTDLAHEVGVEVIEQELGLEDVLAADEVFLTGTAAEVIGVSRIDERQIGEGSVGPVTRRFIQAFRSLVAACPED